MAEGILRYKAEKNGWELTLDSAGTGDWHVGESPDERAIRFMRSKGIDISNLVARQITKEDFYEFDIILAMDPENFSNAKKIMPEDATAKLELAMNLAYPGRNISVPDPYFGGMEGFEKVFDMLWEALEQENLRKVME
jgi:protein-tyrosine phosphatase